MKPREIILRPLITEKTTLMQERENTVCFGLVEHLKR